MKAPNPSKKIKDMCLYLGEPYVLSVIDLENVIYRNLPNGYDIEVSGLDNNRKSLQATIYVWQTDLYQGIVETISDINSLGDLKQILTQVSEKYANLEPSKSDRA